MREDHGFFVGVFGPVLVGVEAVRSRRSLRHLGLKLGTTGPFVGPRRIEEAVDLLHREGAWSGPTATCSAGLDLKELTSLTSWSTARKMRRSTPICPGGSCVRGVASPLRGCPCGASAGEYRRRAACQGSVRARPRPRRSSPADVSRDRLEVWFVPDTTWLRTSCRRSCAQDAFRAWSWTSTARSRAGHARGHFGRNRRRHRGRARLAVQGVRQNGTVGQRRRGRTDPRSQPGHRDLPDEEATTIAGLVIHEAPAIPEAGQVFTFYGFRFEVLRKTRNRITALRISPAVAPSAETENV